MSIIRSTSYIRTSYHYRHWNFTQFYILPIYLPRYTLFRLYRHNYYPRSTIHLPTNDMLRQLERHTNLISNILQLPIPYHPLPLLRDQIQNG